MPALDEFSLIARLFAPLAARHPGALGLSDDAALIDGPNGRQWAVTADDIVWRRSKLGLRLSAAEIAAIDDWIAAHRTPLESPLREAGGRT